MTPEAQALLASWDTGEQIAPLSDQNPSLNDGAAYKIAAEIRDARVARGETPIGRKIGFTNPDLMAVFGVKDPIWGWMYDTTFNWIADQNTADLTLIADPRLEAEIAVKFARAPRVDMSVHEIADCLEWVALGYEIVTSAYPDWKFKAPDTMAAQSMHRAYFCGEPLAWDNLEPKILDNLSVVLSNGDTRLEGSGVKVLGGPLRAISHLMKVVENHDSPRIEAGEIITTGSLTDVPSIRPGETWTTEISDIALPGITLSLT